MSWNWKSLLFWLLALLLPAAAPAAENTFTIGYLNLAEDPRHAALRGYTNVLLRPARDPFQGARTALAESRIIGRALGVELTLERSQGADAQELIAAVERQRETGTRLFLLDAPAPVVAEVARATRDLGVTLFNVSAAADRLRGEACQPHLFHVYPSRAMLADALAQYAVGKRWTEVLVLQGPRPEDRVWTEAFLAAAERFGLEVVDVRRFTQGNDPRQRQRNNIPLLTQGDYDLVFVADAERGLGRYVPYRTKQPRPVIGDQGLTPAAWHWAYERHGAPQVNRRFEDVAGRHMSGYDWAAWAAVKLLTGAAAATRSTEPERLVDHLLSDRLTFDTYRGSPGSFRPWNRQLRQPILLHTADAVIARAPVEGFLHPVNELDTLGRDRRAAACQADPAPDA